MASQKHIINELLAFVQYALNNSDLDHHNIVKSCEISFGAEEINKAKTLLFKLLGKTAQKPSLQCSQNLLDIIELLQKTAVDKAPVFLAKQLDKLPLVLFERQSILKLMMEIYFANASLVEIKSKLVAANYNVNKLCDQVYAMHSAERKCRLQGTSEDTDEVKTASEDTKLGAIEAPRPAPRTSMGKATTHADSNSNATAVQPNLSTISDTVELSELDLEVDKDGFLKVKQKETNTNQLRPEMNP